MESSGVGPIFFVVKSSVLYLIVMNAFIFFSNTKKFHQFPFFFFFDFVDRLQWHSSLWHCSQAPAV